MWQYDASILSVRTSCCLYFLCGVFRGFCVTLQRVRGYFCNKMHHINIHLTYLLTYLLYILTLNSNKLIIIKIDLYSAVRS